MLGVFKCVAAAVVEKGLPGLAEMIPGGKFAYDVAETAWKKYRERKKDADARGEIQQLAAATFDEAKIAAAEAVAEAVNGRLGVSGLDRLTLELYLTQIPATIRRTLKRSDDPTGTTLPATFSLDSPDEFAELLPPRPPRFATGQPLAGRPGWVLALPLGVGGFGEVWLVRHARLASLSGAVKFCHGEAARDLLHESAVIDRVMAAGKHPNIVQLLDLSLDGDTPWVMFEYIEGGDLSDQIREWQGLSSGQRLERALAALEQLAGAVGHFHRLASAVVHRDLKPGNILCERASGVLRITDFGIGAVAARAALSDEAGAHGGRLLSYLRGSHTPLYASPQQRAGAAPDPRDDVYALGVIAYQMLTGELSHGPGADFGDDLRDAGAPDNLVALIGRCVAQKPERRPADGGDLREQLRDLTPAKPRTVPGVRRPVAHAPAQKRPGVIAAIAKELEAATSEQPVTKAMVHEALKRQFPERDPSGMRATVNAQIPGQFRTERRIALASRPTEAGTGYWIDVPATAKLRAGKNAMRSTEGESGTLAHATQSNETFRVWLVRVLRGQGRVEAAEAVERLFGWADVNDYHESGKRTPSQGGSLRFAVKHRGQLYELFAVGGKGEIQLPLQYMTAGPFGEASRRREYLDRLGQIPGVSERRERWDSVSGWPCFPLEVIHDTTAFNQFLGAVVWAASVIRGSQA